MCAFHTIVSEMLVTCFDSSSAIAAQKHVFNIYVSIPVSGRRCGRSVCLINIKIEANGKLVNA